MHVCFLSTYNLGCYQQIIMKDLQCIWLYRLDMSKCKPPWPHNNNKHPHNYYNFGNILIIQSCGVHVQHAIQLYLIIVIHF